MTDWEEARFNSSDALLAAIDEEHRLRAADLEERLAAFLVKTPVKEWGRVRIVYPDFLHGYRPPIIELVDHDPSVGFGEPMPVLSSLWVGQSVEIVYENDQEDYESACERGDPEPRFGSACGVISEVVWHRDSPTICLDWGWCIPLFDVYDIKPYGGGV